MIDLARYAERTLRERQDLSPEERADLERIKQEALEKGANYDVFDGVSLAQASEAYKEARDVLARKEFGGYATIIPVAGVSLDQLVADPNIKDYFGYVNDSPLLRRVVSPRIEVAINSATIAPEETAGLSFKDREEWLLREEDKIRAKTGLGDRIGLPTHHAPSLAQFDVVYQRLTGENLYPNYWVGSIDPIGDLGVAAVGRGHPDYPLRVVGWHRLGNPVVRAARAVVLPPRK